MRTVGASVEAVCAQLVNWEPKMFLAPLDFHPKAPPPAHGYYELCSTNWSTAAFYSDFQAMGSVLSLKMALQWGGLQSRRRAAISPKKLPCLSPLKIRSISNRSANDAPHINRPPRTLCGGKRRGPTIARNFWQFRAW